MIEYDFSSLMTYCMKTLHLIIISSLLFFQVSSPVAASLSFTGSPEQVFMLLAENKWGAGNVTLPTPYTWIEYEEDLGQRFCVDFENGTCEIEVLLRTDIDPYTDSVITHMEGALSNLYTQRPTDMLDMIQAQIATGHTPATPDRSGIAWNAKLRRYTYIIKKGDTLSALSRRFRVPVTELVRVNGLASANTIRIGDTLIIPLPHPHLHLGDENNKPSATAPVLAGQLSTRSGAPVSYTNLMTFVKERVIPGNMSTRTITGKDGQQRKAVTLRFKLASDHLRVRAQRYYPLVEEHARKYGHDPALIMAVIHTESAFNPRARSPIPAYGLMQLVPRTGGREAYTFVHKRDRIPTASFLYQPSGNIELGSAYLHLLQARYLKAVTNEQNRLYCAIAAYNTGMGNMARAFQQDGSVRRALQLVNRMTPEKVYDQLRAFAPSRQTRAYVKKVNERMPLYK
jgi:LysM repeat protein